MSRYEGNPFIECLPAFYNEVEFFKKISRIPKLLKSGNILSRIAELNSIRNELFIPLSYHYYFYLKIANAINESYKVRTSVDWIKKLNAIKKWYSDPTCPPPVVNRHSVLGLTLIGISGMGKTTTVENVLGLFPQMVTHKDLGIKQVVYLKVDCTTKGSTKQICRSFFDELDKVTGENYFEKYGGDVEEKLVIQMANKALLHHLGILVVDEIHNLESANLSTQKKILNCLKELTNRIGIPIVYIGTDQAVPILFGDFQTASRTQGVGMPPLDRFDEADPEWRYFLEKVWTLQVLDKPGILTEELARAYYRESQGILRLLIQVHCLAQESALFHNSKSITVDQIHNTREQLHGTRKAIIGLEKNDLEILSTYKDIKMTQTYMYDIRDREKNNLKESNTLMSLAKKKWPDLEINQIEECINSILHNFPAKPIDFQFEKLKEGIKNILTQGKGKKRKIAKDKPLGDLIDLCCNAKNCHDHYDLLVQSGIIVGLDEVLIN